MNIAYISGFFDADGSITMSYNSKGDKYKALKIDFSNNEESILVNIQNFLKENGITSFMSKKPPRKETHNKSFTLAVNSNQMCLKLCRLLQSIHPKKLHRVNTVVKYHDSVTNRNGKYTEEEHKRRIAYERLFFLGS